ncbi:MAG: hypothetical protein IJ071_03615 [Ruminococcus sp.]|nr:hypothetical protein [Ruminococcus sp.]
MTDLNENRIFSFSDGCWEALSGAGSREAAQIGRRLAGSFRRIHMGCDQFSQLHLLYALCSGASERGSEVWLCENTDLPSLRFGGRITGADCTVFVHGNGLRLLIFGRDGFPLPSENLREIASSQADRPSKEPGAIRSVTSFKNIYVSNIADNAGGRRASLSAGISCGSRSVRSLWLEFFTGSDDELVFQISEEGMRVNAYSSRIGFISGEKLTIAYACQVAARGETVWLPEEIHFAADSLKGDIRRFPEDSVPPAAAAQRFLTDPLFMCVELASDRERLLRTVSELPGMATVRREVALQPGASLSGRTELSAENGRIIAQPSGRGRILVIAQSASMEAASELCADWCQRLRRAPSK